MSGFVVEMKKSRRAGVLEVLPVVGILGAAYAILNFQIRRDTLLSLPLPPMTVLLTQLYGMVMVLNMFGIIVAATLAYNMEFKGNAIKKMYMLPLNAADIFRNKYLILAVLFLLCSILQNGALAVIGRTCLPAGTFEAGALVKYAVYIFVTSLPVLSFMLFAASRCENIWLTLGIGVAGFFSGMAMALSDLTVFLVNPFVLMMKPAVAQDINIDGRVLAVSVAEAVLFYVLGWLMSKNSHYE